MDPLYTGSQIVKHRKNLGLTQKALAEKLHVTDKAVNKWERGINFPDLGSMESLAAALNTTPAQLLGLEEANRDEIVSSISQLSTAQFEAAQKDVKWLGWTSIAAAVLMGISYFLFGNDVRRTQIAFMLLHCGIIILSCIGIYLLVRYGQIKKFDRTDTKILCGAAAPILIHLGIAFFTGRSVHPILGLCLIGAAFCLIQLLFQRIMRAQPAKALPLILSSLFALWHLWRGTLVFDFALPALCCMTVWLLCRITKVKCV